MSQACNLLYLMHHSVPQMNYGPQPPIPPKTSTTSRLPPPPRSPGRVFCVQFWSLLHGQDHLILSNSIRSTMIKTLYFFRMFSRRELIFYEICSHTILVSISGDHAANVAETKRLYYLVLDFRYSIMIPPIKRSWCWIFGYFCRF